MTVVKKFVETIAKLNYRLNWDMEHVEFYKSIMGVSHFIGVLLTTIALSRLLKVSDTKLMILSILLTLVALPIQVIKKVTCADKVTAQTRKLCLYLLQ
jgi:hypothetical protein